jgi:prepilin-type N-terminal cleavage/methylation domain-containing protein/prepilin-type processing-associated H-X9-DG protein
MRKISVFIPLKRNPMYKVKGYLNGFTLIELLVVISIIMLLMAILLPVTQRIKNQARAVVCQANLRQWGMFFHIYTEGNQGRFFPSVDETSLWFLRGSYLKNDDPNIPPIFNDMNTQGIACCPMAKKPGSSKMSIEINKKDGTSYNIEGKAGSTFSAWEITSGFPPFRCSYGYNLSLLSPFFYIDIPRFVSWKGIELSSARYNSKVPVFFDCDRFYDAIASENFPPLRYEQGVLINRHNGYVNGLFLDWSVRKVGLKELWTLKWNERFDIAGPWTKAGGVQPEDWPEWMQGFKDY